MTDSRMSLAKIPIISVLTLLFKIILTPPNPPPTGDELVPTVQSDRHWLRRYRLNLAHLGQFSLAAIEIATIASNHRLSSQQPRSPLAADGTVNGGYASRLRFTTFGILGAALWIFGGALRMRTYHNLGRFFRYEISIQKNHELIKTGPYAYVRHPSYTGLTLVVIGWLMWNCAPGSWLCESGFLDSMMGKMVLGVYLVTTLLYAEYVTLSRMSKEDEALRKRFGKEWDEWARKVPYSLIPGIY